MNQNKKVVTFTFAAVFVLLVGSVLAEIYGNQFPLLKRVSLISDIIHNPASQPKQTPVAQKPSGPVTPQDKTSFADYTTPRTIVHFNTEKNIPALPLLMQKLAAAKAGEQKKIRIAWFGDSMIEADLLTQTFRKRMQGYFGGEGVGFVPGKSVSADIRQSVRCKTIGQWKEENLKTDDRSLLLHLCGHGFTTADGEIFLKDLTVTDTLQPLEKSLICGQTSGDIEITVNGQALSISPKNLLNRIPLDNSNKATVDVAIKNKALPVYGISVEPAKGVVVDNFSFRGITGIELAKLDSSFLQSLDANNPYDLIVLEYGTNLLFRPETREYSYYYKKMKPVLQYLKRCMPHSEFLLISSSDRAFKYDDEWKTAIGIDSLISVQARLAYENNMAFYNMYESMGGEGTIVRWADSSETYANKDYIHPNHRGAEVLGNMLFNSFFDDYKKLKPSALKTDTEKHTVAN